MEYNRSARFFVHSENSLQNLGPPRPHKSGNPEKRAQAIVKAVANYTDAKLIAELSEDLGEAMVGINESEIALLMAERGK